jgi:hypothetical protein
MSLKKFGENDIILNTMKTHPKCEFFVFDGKIYYNNIPEQSGAFSNRIYNVPPGHVSLYEYNIDKLSGSNNFIYPFITKGGAGDSFSTVSAQAYTTNYAYGDTITSSYPMSASIVREFMSGAVSGGAGETIIGTTSSFYGRTIYYETPEFRHFYALKNRLNFYGIRSEHYKVTSSYGDKSKQVINLISIPSIIFGSKIKPGSLSLKWYFTGSLAAELQDKRHNGELIEVSGSNTGSVGGVVLYDEGFILLTGSWNLNGESIKLAQGASADNPKWIYFGAGANDGVTRASAGTSYGKASFDLSFKGTTEVQVMTMFAHARRGEVNYSNNPTFLSYNQSQSQTTSSQIYEENSSRTIFNTVSSSYLDYAAPFKRQVYISRVAIYDKNKNLIGVATISNPVLKEEDQDLSFKLKLDI